MSSAIKQGVAARLAGVDPSGLFLTGYSEQAPVAWPKKSERRGERDRAHSYFPSQEVQNACQFWRVTFLLLAVPSHLYIRSVPKGISLTIYSNLPTLSVHF